MQSLTLSYGAKPTRITFPEMIRYSPQLKHFIFNTFLMFVSAYGNALNICMQLKDKGLLTKNMDSCTIRFTPPLTIDECQLREAIQIISDVIHSLKPVC